MTISEKIKELCSENGTSMYALEKQLGLGNGTIGKWGKNGRIPNYAKLSAVCDALGVSVETLMSDHPQADQGIKKDLPKEVELTELQKKAWNVVLNMDEDALRAIVKLWGSNNEE